VGCGLRNLGGVLNRQNGGFRPAQYSTKDSYSPPDGRGQKHAFLARMLVSDIAVGTQVTGVITRTQPKVPEAKVRGSQEGFQ
jgi:hypothetical protein